MDNNNNNNGNGKQRQWVIVLIWIILTLMCFTFLPYAGKPFKMGTISDPGAESTIANNIMKKELPYSGARIFVFYQSKNLTTDNSIFRSQVNKSLSKLDDLPFDNYVISPYQNTKQISKDKHHAYAVIETNLTTEALASKLNVVRYALGNPSKLDMIVGGAPSYTVDVYSLSESNLIRGEIIALPICFVIMVFVFSGFLAALITILSGIISITIIISIIYILGHYIDLTVFVLNIATMLGLGLSLDYTLLITYRFKEEYAKFRNCNQTIQRTLATAGKSVFFSGLIVLISIASLVFFPINVLNSIGVGGIVVVIVTVTCALSFLPAMLCLAEKNITKNISQLQHISSENIHSHRWYGLAILVMKYPFSFLIPTIIILLALGYPFLNVKLNSSDAKILPPWVESRQMVDAFTNNFNENLLTPINIVLTAKNKSILTKSNIAAIYDYAQKIKKDPRIDKISSIVTIDPNMTKQQYQQIYSSSNLPFNSYQKHFFKETTKGKYTVMTVISKYTKDDERNFDLVNTLRNNTIGNGITKKVTGNSAEIIDTIHIVYNLFFKIIIMISIVTYLTLVWLLRSLILPLKAILMNFLSLSVCYGMLVFIFQEGHFANFLHFKPVGFTDLNLPILLFFALFGLSMDYEVFLLTRIREYYEMTQDNAKSVALGLEKSARIITSAALIMVIVAGAFVTADIVLIKSFGLGAALAIAIDASLIRLLLVPATMRLLGDWNWYFPKWLDRLLPDLHFDAERRSCHIPNHQHKPGSKHTIKY